MTAKTYCVAVREHLHISVQETLLGVRKEFRISKRTKTKPDLSGGREARRDPHVRRQIRQAARLFGRRPNLRSVGGRHVQATT